MKKVLDNKFDVTFITEMLMLILVSDTPSNPKQTNGLIKHYHCVFVSKSISTSSEGFLWKLLFEGYFEY